jgi:uncharacterized protein (DUF1501 family)
MNISRRKFIQLSSLASASMMVPKFLKAFERPGFPVTNGKILVVLQLSGGNDGLNTIIPYRNDLYYKARPQISIKRDDALFLTDDTGLNPSFTGIKNLFDEGNVSILNSVGYSEPNRSHFRSMDIWQTASQASELIATGWLGRYLDGAVCTDCNKSTLAIELDDSLSLSMKGENLKGLALRDINQFYRASKDSYLSKVLANEHDQKHQAKLAGYLYKTLRETVSSAEYVYEHNKAWIGTQTYPDTQLGKRMKTIASLILTQSETKVYYVSHGSFDTHVGQRNQQDKLFKQMDEAMMAFVAELKANNRFNDVLVMTFSEFGRRVGENASNGTDHGTASNMFFIGGGLKAPGIYNEMSDLNDLDQGDLKYQIDFKQVYATVLNRWLDTDPQKILGRKYDQLKFI